MLRGVILDADTLGPDTLDLSPLTQLPIQWTIHGATAPEQVGERIADADVIITNKAPVGTEQMAAASQLKLIGVAATGFNVIDIEAAKSRGVAVSNCVAYGTPSVVQHVFAMLLALSTRLLDYHRDATGGRWQNSPTFCLLDYPVQELAGRTLGIVGYGELGSSVAKIAEAFGMTVKIASLPGREQEGRTPVAELLPEVDVLTLHCPLTDQTRNLIDTAELAAMKPSALLINAARGGIVNEQALADALRNGEIAGAGVDVLSQEPPRNGNPLLADDIPNLILTPHTAWTGQQARQEIVRQLAQSIEAFNAGQEYNRVC